MKALQLTGNKENPLAFVELPMPEPKAGEVLVQLKASALNRRDYWIREGMYPGIRPNVTLGSDGCGTIVKLGENVSESLLNQEVVINPNQNWGENPIVQSDEYTMLGMPSNGTFAEYLAVPVDRVHPKPAHLTSEEAAALPLGALTAYRAVFTHAEVKEGDSVLISGVGGGVAQFAFLFAQTLGAKVFVTSGSEEKSQKVLDAGAAGAVNYKSEDWDKQLKKISGGFDAVIDSAGGDGFSKFVRIMNPAGRIVFYGATRGVPPKLDVFTAFFRQVRFQGSTMGNDIEFEKMLQFIGDHKLKPFVDSVRPFDEILDAFEIMAKNTQFGKLVVRF